MTPDKQNAGPAGIISLGYNIDFLLNPEKPENGGLKLGVRNGADTDISGSVLIHGQAGAGKSTLALQILLAALQAKQNVKYIALEQSRNEILAQAANVSPKLHAQLITGGSADNPLKTLDDYKKAGTIYSVMKDLLEDNAGKSIVIIDSLSTLWPLGEHKERLSYLIQSMKDHDLIPVATHEGNMPLDYFETLFDVVIKLSTSPDKGYFTQYIEIAKSRYVKAQRGPHPYRILKGRGIVAFPSLVTIDLKGKDDTTKPGPDAFLGHHQVDKHLAKQAGGYPAIMLHGIRGTSKQDIANAFSYFTSAGPPNGQSAISVMINLGASWRLATTYKQSKPRYFSKYKDKESTHILAPSRNAPIDLKPNLSDCADLKPFLLDGANVKSKDHLNHSLEDSKSLLTLKLYEWTPAPSAPTTTNPWRVLEIGCHAPRISQEELINLIRALLKCVRVGSLVLCDLNAIVSSFSFLESTAVSQNLFLPTLVDICRNQMIPALIVGTFSPEEHQHTVFQSAASAVDVVMNTSRLKVFGRELTSLSMEPTLTPESDPAPIAVKLEESAEDKAVRYIKLDFEELETLVGFHTGEPYRPGSTLILPSFTDTERDYNKEQMEYLKAAFGYNKRGARGGFAELKEIPHADSEYIQRSAKLLGDRPRDQTLIMAVDEVSYNQSGLSRTDSHAKSEDDKLVLPSDKLQHLTPYKRDLLVMLCPLDSPLAKDPPKSYIDYEAQSRGIEGFRHLLGHDVSAHTYSCLLLDALVCDYRRQTSGFRNIFDDATGKVFYENCLIKPLKGGAEAYKNLSALVRTFGCNKFKGTRGVRVQLSKEKLRENLKAETADDNWALLTWYSRLEDMFKLLPDLREKVTIVPLPGGGFTGDWWVGCVTGSASLSLGRQILAFLTTPRQQHARFIRGTGLPVLDSMFSNFKFDRSTSHSTPNYRAWKYARTDNQPSLHQVLEYHKSANQRRWVPHYPRLASSLIRVFKTLCHETSKGDEAAFNSLINDATIRMADRLKYQVGIMMAPDQWYREALTDKYDTSTPGKPIVLDEQKWKARIERGQSS